MYLDHTSGQGAALLAPLPAPAAINQKQAIKPAANGIAKIEGSPPSTTNGENGTWFDQNIDIRAPEGDALTQRVLQACRYPQPL